MDQAPESRLQRFTRRLSTPGIVLAGWAVFAMMVIATADVVGTIFNRPIAGAIEVVTALMVMVIFLALAHAEDRDQHITVDLVYARLPARMRQVCSVFGLVLSFAFFSAMAWQGWKLFWASWRIREFASGSLPFPVYPSKALFALGVTAAAIVILVKLVTAMRELPQRAHEPAYEKQETA